jgi:REP element-mobilizing transposase RayT
MHMWKRLRLRDKAPYQTVGQPCHVTFNVLGRRLFFRDPRAAQIAVDVIAAQAEATSVTVYAYCVMATHIHLVIASSARCDVPQFVSRVKNFIMRACREHGLMGLSWQTRFHDRVLRTWDDVERAVHYDICNPLKDSYPVCTPGAKATT